MSIQAVAWVLEHSKSRGTARLVLIALANHVGNDTDICWPAMRTIALEAGVASTSTVKAALASLAELHEVEVVDPGDNRRPGRYRLAFLRSSPEHKSNAAFGPGQTLRSVQGEQNRNEPSLTVRAPRALPSFIDDTFEVTPPMRSWAEVSCPGVDLTTSTQRFVNHFKELRDQGAKRGRMVDWERGWRNWLLKDFDRLPSWAKKQGQVRR